MTKWYIGKDVEADVICFNVINPEFISKVRRKSQMPQQEHVARILNTQLEHLVKEIIWKLIITEQTMKKLWPTIYYKSGLMMSTDGKTKT